MGKEKKPRKVAPLQGGLDSGDTLHLFSSHQRSSYNLFDGTSLPFPSQ